jgi:hypothetical protein
LRQSAIGRRGTKKPDLADRRLAGLTRIATVKQSPRTTDVVVVKLRRRGAGKYATSQAAELGRELRRTLRATRRLQVPQGEADKHTGIDPGPAGVILR